MNPFFNKIAKTSLVISIASTLTIPSFAFANEKTSEEDSLPTVDLQEIPLAELEENQLAETDITLNSNEETVVNEEASETSENVEVQLEDETPNLLPGDLFYFIKIAFEKIQIAFTFDDMEEAKLLATFASERLAEAEALFVEGKDEEALETIEKALEHFETTEEITEEEANSDNMVDEDLENSVEEDAELGDIVVEDTEEAKVNEEKEEVQEIVSQNIIALQAAMEKVKNPVAKAALQKNIEKSYAKLAKKLAKMEQKQTEINDLDEESGLDGQAIETEELIQTSDSNVVNQETTAENDDTLSETVQGKIDVKSINVEKKEAKEKKKEQKVQIKNEVKQEAKEAKNNGKQKDDEQKNENKGKAKGKNEQ